MAETGDSHAHHTSKSDMSSYVLPLSILLAAIILGYSMMTAATALNGGLLKIAENGGSLGGSPSLVPDPSDPTLAPPATTKTMAELAQNGAATLGEADAPITIVEFSDYQCPFCRRWFDDSKAKLVQNYVDTGKVKLIWKDFPLSFHPMAGPTANAARCAGDQGKYWEFHDAAFIEQGKLNPTATVQYTLDDIKKWGADLGLNTATFNACVDAGKYNDAVQANFTEGSTVGVSGTPSFFIGKSDGTGQLIVGAQPYATFEAAINSLST